MTTQPPSTPEFPAGSWAPDGAETIERCLGSSYDEFDDRAKSRYGRSATRSNDASWRFSMSSNSTPRPPVERRAGEPRTPQLPS